MVTIDEQIKILTAYKEGKTIQIFNSHSEVWEDVPPKGSELWAANNVTECQFNFFNYEYRIKPDQEEGVQPSVVEGPAKTREIAHRLIKEQITKALDPMLKPQELQREIKAFIEDRFDAACGENLSDAAYNIMAKGLNEELDGNISKALKGGLARGFHDYLHDFLSADQVINLIKDSPELNNVLLDVVKGSALAHLKAAAADAMEKYIGESDHGYDKIWDWIQNEINKDEYLKDDLIEQVKKVADDQIENHLSVNIQLD